MKRWRRRIGARLLAWCGPFLVRRLSSTWKTRIEGLENFEAARAGNRGILIAIWHGQMLPPMSEHQGRDFCVLVSHSADGDLMAQLLRKFGYRTVRGSSHRGASNALRSLLDELEEGSIVVITPDGPRGPRHSIKRSLAWLARESRFAIVPIGVGFDRAWHLRSWDRFCVPKPRARVGLVWGTPIRVASDADDAAIEAATEAVRQEVFAAERRAFEIAGGTPDW